MKVVKNFLWNMGYQVFVLLLPIITIPYVSRVLGPTGIGINAYTNSIVQYFILFGTLGLTVYGNREVAYQRDNSKKLSNIFWELTFFKLITTGIAVAFYLRFVLVSGEYEIFYLIQGLFLLASAIDVSWFFQGLEEFKITVVRNTFVKVISLIMIFTMIRSKNDLWLYILILGASQLIGNITLLPYLSRYVHQPIWGEMNFLRHVKPTIAMFVPQIASQVYLQLNKTMLGAFIGVEASGFYDNSDKIIKILLAIVTATGTVLLPHMAHSFARGDRKAVFTSLSKSMHFILLLAFPMASGLAAVSPVFTRVFFGRKFEAVSVLLAIESLVIILVGISNAIGIQYLLPTNQVRPFTVSVGVGAAVNIVLNVPLILIWGTVGAMIATVVSELSVSLFQLSFVRKQMQVGSLFTESWKYLIAAILMGIYIRFYLTIIPFGDLLKLISSILLGLVIYSLILILLRPRLLIDMVLSMRKQS
ncbi:flippase [Lacticaseibacillus paracasei]|uniref:Flippase n=1 Tax=Lacticaseibacillus paracasei TaxID=1597 RepID=A0AAP4JJZ8_LACPA|nr:flippase [Lacticaseibacillus paracasei]MDM7454743.1 flippase [Lacticaseibacillus paracasei]MDM7472266.1 flippase [Lacticaseibacillus paracasei]